MKTKIIIIILLFNLSALYAQKEAANWYFGEYAGLNFNNGSPVGQTGKLDTREGCSSISNSNGQLLFYTDGTTIWDRKHRVMPNGTELFGNNSSTQSAIIVPKPESNHIFYIFTVDSSEITFANELNKGLNYTEIDMNLNNGFGDIVPFSKNKHLITYDINDPIQTEWKCSEKIAAIIHEDESSFWIVTHFIDTFYSFKIDDTGVINDPIKTIVDEVIDVVEFVEIGSKFSNISALGYLKISPNGKKLAIAHSSTLDSKTSGKVFLYNFNDNTGKVSSNGKLLLGDTFPYGLEFSSKSKKLYTSTNNFVLKRERDENNNIFTYYKFEGSTLYQFDLDNPDIVSSKKEIHQSSTLLAGALQLAIDGKIYRAKYSQPQVKGLSSLAAINKPDLSGELCDYDNNSVDLASGTFSKYGLPPFISSFFLLTFDYEFTCFESPTHFFITSDYSYDSLIWDFGDDTPPSNEDDPYHLYSNPGIYTVTLITTFDGEESKPVTKEIEIINLAEIKVLETPYELVECDANDNNSNDGIATFNLQRANDPISLGNENSVDVYYYKDLITLNDDTDNINSLPTFYRNINPNQLIYAKVIKNNSDCYAVGEVILNTTSEFNNFVSEEYISCNLGDGTALFNLTSQIEIIKTDLSLPSSTSISFHISKDYASNGFEPLDENYISESKTIYVRIENENICYGIGELNLKIYQISNINLEEEFDICKSSFPIKINAGITLGDEQNYLYDWGNGNDLQEIEISEEGEYNVIITDKSTFCNVTRNIKVNVIETPEIQEIKIQENTTTYTITIRATSENVDLLYSINNDFGIYGNSPTFSGLSPGTYTAYVTDQINCNTIEKQFHIFGFPKFFTPNNDGINDVWEIKGLNFDEYTYSNIHIFNKFGKLLVTLNPDSYWDGIYNGKYLSSDDYWFSVSVTDQENITNVYKGHFSLIGR